MDKIGFIGCGKMASAIIKGLISKKIISDSNIIASCKDIDLLAEKAKSLGIEVADDNKKVVNSANIVFIAVKPNQIGDVMADISTLITKEKLIISILAGVQIRKIESFLPEGCRIIRVMPNITALIGEGMSGIYPGTYATEQDVETVKNMLMAIGNCIVLDNEEQMDIVTAISGSGPAFYCKVINDIAKAGEKLGMDYNKALLLSIQTAIGSAKMALQREIPIEQMIANVATKGGCTRVGIDCMEELNTEDIFYNVIKNTTKKAHELGQ